MSVLTTDRVSVRGPAHFIQNDTRTQIVWFTVNRYRDGIDLAGLSWSIHILNAAGIPDVAVPFEQPDVRGDKIIIGWLVRGTATAAAGDLTFNLRGVGEDENGNALRWSGGDEKRPVYTAQESEPSDEQEAALYELDALIEYVGNQLPGVISAGKEARAAANAANASAEAASNAGTAAASAANAAAEATENAKNLPYIGENGNWYLWDTKTGAYVDSGKPSRGEGSEGGGGINEETDPTVPNWAKAPNKPSYTAAEVGALPATYVPPNQTAAQVGADPAGTASKAVSTHNTSGTAHNDIRLELSALAARINAALNSDDVNLDQMAEIVAYIKSNKSLIDAITTGKVSVSDIVNNLTTNTANKPLSAAQGVALKKLIDAITVPTKLSQLAEDASHRLVTDAEKSGWSAKLDATALPEAVNTALAQAKASGKFDGAPGDPGYTPVKGKDYFDGEDGISPTVAVSNITGGHRIAITDKSGTKTVDVLDGEKGDAGRGITSVARTSGNGAAGTTDTYTITYTDGSKSTFAVNNGKDGSPGTNGRRGTGILKVTTAPASYTTTTGGKNPIKRMAISTIRSQAHVDEVLVGDQIAYSYYHYHVYYLDATYAYMDTYQSIRGTAGSDATVTSASIKSALGYTPADAAAVKRLSLYHAIFAPSPQLPADGRKIGDSLGGGGVVEKFTNLITKDPSNAQLNKRYSSSDALKDADGVVAFDAFPVAHGDTIRINLDAGIFANNYSRVIFYNAGMTRISGDANAASYVTITHNDGVSSFSVHENNAAFMRLNLHINTSGAISASDIDDLIITRNEAIEYEESPGEIVTVAADFDAANISAQNIYDYMDALVAKHPRYMTKETLGKDESGLYDWNRYTASRRSFDAWVKPNYPAMYGWTNGSATIYSASVSPRVGDTLYTTPYIGTAKGTVTAVSNADQSRTVSGVIYTRDASKDVAPTLVYTYTDYSPYRLGAYAEYKNQVLDANKSNISTITSIADGVLIDARSNTYNRYPLGDVGSNFEKLPVIVLGANEHGGNISGDPAEPAIVTARLAKDLCERVNMNNAMLNMLNTEYMIVFCPIINPWGFSTASYTNSNGINLDRNYDTPGWGNSTDANKGDYGGSEAETQNFMNTLCESGARIALANHALGSHLDETTGEAVSAGMCAYMLGRNNPKYNAHLAAIAETMSVNYDLAMNDMGEAPAESYGKTRSYIDHLGIEGGAVEMSAIDGYLLHGGARHTAKILEADYTLLLQFLQMLIECQE